MADFMTDDEFFNSKPFMTDAEFLGPPGQGLPPPQPTPIAPAEPTLGSMLLGGMVAPDIPETAPMPIMPRGRRVPVGLGDAVLAPPEIGMPISADSLQARQALYERKSLADVTGERLRTGALNLGAGVATSQALDAMVQVDVLNEAARLEAEGADMQAFADLAERSSRFPIGVLMDAGLRDRALASFGERPIGALERGVEYREKAAQIDRSPVSEAFMEKLSEGGFLDKEAWEIFASDPGSVLGQIGVENIPNALYTIAGSMLGGPAIAGAAGFQLEGGASITEAMDRFGVDTSNPETMLAALEDPEVGGQIKEFALKRGVPIAAMDALSLGLAGVLGKTLPRKLLGQLVVEPTSEGVGEALAGLISTGQIDAGEVMAEVIGGGPSAVAQTGAEVARGAVSRMMQQQPPEPAPAIGDIMAQRLEAMRAEAPIQPQAQPAPEAPTVPVQPVAPPQVGIAPEAPTEAPQAPVVPLGAVPVVTPTPTAAPEAQVAPTTPEAPVVPAPAPTVDPDVQAPQIPDTQAQEPVVVPAQAEPVATQAVPEKPVAPSKPEDAPIVTSEWTETEGPEGAAQPLMENTRTGEVITTAQFDERVAAQEEVAAPEDVEAAAPPAEVTAPVQEPGNWRASTSRIESFGKTLGIPESEITGTVDQMVATVEAKVAEINETAPPSELPSKPATAAPEAVSTQKQANAALPEGVRAVRRNPENTSEWTLLGDNAEVIGTFMSTSPDGIDAATLSDMERGQRPQAAPMPAKETHPAVQNEDGSPKTLYHGTSDVFEEFQAPTLKEGEHEFRADSDIGVFLTSDPEAASYYAAEGDKDTRNIRPVKVQMTNPLIYDYEGRKKDSALNRRLADQAKAAGHDGLILRNVKDTPQLTNVTEDVYVAFDPAQVSSVFEKKGKKKPIVAKEIAPDEAKKKAPTTKKPQPKGSLAPTFLGFSFSNRNSVYEAAFRAAGIDPDKARLMTVDQQIAALRRVILAKFGVRVVMPKMLVSRKTITGRKTQIEKQQIGYRDAIDQMLDAYRQMTMLAHIFGVPEKAIGLTDKNGTQITLSLVRRLRGALGSYSGGERTIALPGRSNSFAHEWGHAFDHWLSGFLMDMPVDEVENLLSRDVFNDGIQPGSTRSSEVAQAFVGLLQSLFGDSAKMAMMQIDLQQQATDTLKNGKPSPKAKRAMKALDDIKSGKRLPREVTNDFFKTSLEYDKMFNTKGYFTDPAEMLARAFETFAGVKASMVSDLPTSFLSKPDWAYTESEETRSKMTFPRGVDAERVFLSIERLGDELRKSEIFGTEGIAKKPEDVDVFDMRHWDKWKPKGSLLAQEREAWRKNKETLKAVETDQTKMRKLRDWASYYASTVNGNLRGIVRRQPVKARKALTNLLDMFMKDPGSGRDTGVSWERAVEAWSKRMTNRFENITTAFNLQRLNKKEMLELRRLLTVSGSSSDNANLVKAAASLRRMLDETWRYLDSAGVKIGYVKNGWLPRIIDMDVALAKAGDFKKQAAKVYSIMFDRDVRQAEMEDQISDVRRLTAQLTRATRTDEHGESFRVNLFSPDEIATIKEWRKAVNTAAKAEADAKEGDSVKVATAEEANEALAEIHEEVLDIMDKVFSEESARAWHAKILMGGPMDFDTKGPDSGFTKKRKMPAETDELMIDFYSGDPLSLIQQYLQMAPRRAEYVRRDTSSDGKPGKIERLLANAESHGADGRDIREIRNSINMLTGRSSAPTHAASQWVGGWVYVAATVTLLKRAFFSSWAEPLAAGLRTGNPRDSLRAMTAFMGQMVSTGKARDRVELARIIGLVTSAQHESIMMNRFGGDINPNSKQGKILANFFKYTLLTGLTNMQRMSMMAVSANAIRRHLEAAIHKKSKWSIEELNEIGIGKEHHQALLDWINTLEGDIPKADDMIGVDGGFYNDAAALWASATGELVQQIIQNPTRYNRPTAAMDSKFRMMYGITGFIYSFHSNVIAPTFKRHIEERGDTESLAKYVARSGVGSVRNLAIAAPSVAALFTGHLLVTMLREALFNPDKWKELEEDDDEDALIKWLLERTFARTGLIGAWDIPYNLYTGVKYSRDLAGAYAGPHTSWALSNIEDIVRLGSDRNAASTNTAEWNALDTVLELLMETGSSLAISSMPGGSIAAPVYGGAMWAIDAYNPSDVLTDMMIGEKGERHGKGDRPWWEVGD